MSLDELSTVGALWLETETLGDTLLAVEFGAVGAEGGQGGLDIADLAGQQFIEMCLLQLQFVVGWSVWG